MTRKKPAAPVHVAGEVGDFASSPSWQNTRRLAQAAPSADVRLLEAPSERLRVLAQLDRAFILATDGRAVVIVDQHAAHERVAYEAIVASALSATSEGRVPQQPLLVPDLIELNRSDADMLEATLDALAAAGVEIEAFGHRVYRVTAMPAALASRHFDVRGYLEDVDDETPGTRRARAGVGNDGLSLGRACR